ncbi:MAG: hypothetical protein KatS3mg094_393 [Candidatus Parcubacteria bacterium]|nr:MAG: hypothetical protein KatS3mg094_393 [Candidatus Parcubacteria bacterium]
MYKQSNILILLGGILVGSFLTSSLLLGYLRYNNQNNINKNIESYKNNYFENNFDNLNLKKSTSNIDNNEINNIDYDTLDDEYNFTYEELKPQIDDKAKKNLENKTSDKNQKLKNKDNNNNNQQLLTNIVALLNTFRNNSSYDLNLNNNTSSNNNNTNKNYSNNNQDNNINNNNNLNNNSNDSNNNSDYNNNSSNNSNNSNNSDNSNEEVNIDNNNSDRKILISEILIDGGNSNDEYIELYNPNNFEVNLSNWKLVKVNKNGNQQVIIGLRTRETFENKIIRPFSYLLIANVDGFYSNMADIRYSSSYNLAKDNSIMLLDNNNRIVDLVGWGNARNYEVNSFFSNPSQGLSLNRKAGEESTGESMNNLEASFGNSFDSNNNNSDFVLMNPNPQNSNSSQEIPPKEIQLINFEDNDNLLIFEIKSPYQELDNSRYVVLGFEIENDEQNVDSFIKNNWQNFVINNMNLPSVIFYGKNQRIEININNNNDDDDGKIYLLALISNNQLINWVPDLND